MNVSAVSFDAKSGNYMAKVGSKTIKSYSKAYVERRVKAMVGDVEVAMAAAVAALGADGEVLIEEAEAINKSYPDFYEHLKALGTSITLQTV
jgi:3-phosphoshikimate 1-carboxyvinyltransferase